MIIDFTKVLLDVRDQTPLITEKLDKVSNEKIRVEATFQFMAGEALGWNLPGDEKMSADEKLKMGNLIQLIYANPQNVELSRMQLELIVERIAKVYSPLVVVAVENALK